MKWAIIVLIMLSLIGSMMWVMPTPRQRMQAKLRLEARKLGFHVTLAKLSLPRATGEMEGDKRELPLYRKARNNLDKREKQEWKEWAVCRVNSQGNTGLPEGWSWIKGEYVLPPAVLSKLCDWLATLTPEVVAVESTAIHLSLYWTEPDKKGELERISEILDKGIEAKL